MKRLFTRLLLCSALLHSAVTHAANLWQQVDAARAPKNLQIMHPTQFLVYTVDEATLKLQMWNLSTDPADGMIVTLPLPDGSFRDFNVWMSPIMPEELATKYPEIKTFSGTAIGNQQITAKLELTPYGITAMIYDGDNTSFIDPFDNYHDGFYMVHYKRDETRAPENRMKCLVKGHENITPGVMNDNSARKNDFKSALRVTNGTNLRTYRLALSADSFYCHAATGVLLPTITQALAKMTTSMNRINGVYTREFSVQMVFCSKEDTLIFGCAGHTNGADPFKTIDNNGNACLSLNQPTCNSRIGSANYDIGHVFTTGGGGISSLGVVCQNSQKAESCTGSSTPVGDGFDIDYVAHEMGHEYGSDHTFNNNIDGSCSGNAVSYCAYEPGSGATIMDYAGICSPDDLAYHSDAYFSASSLLQINSQLAGIENSCAVITPTGNKPVSLPSFSASYYIPYKTPFELIGPAATDSVADTANTYGWTQYNLGDFGKELKNTYFRGPIFRSFNPAYNPTRIFPKLSMVLAGHLTNVTAEGALGEKAPDTARYLTFRMVVRDILNGNGCFLFPDDTIHLNVVPTPSFAGFAVTSQNVGGIIYNGHDSQTITWNVVNTNVAPVSADSVDINVSADGGNTWIYYLGRFPNNGSASVTIPNPPANITTARIKVKATGNVFFNVNSNNFTIDYNSSYPVTNGVKQLSPLTGITIFPVPAHNTLRISSENGTQVQYIIYNTLGQQICNGQTTGKTEVPVATWIKGVYYARFTDMATGNIVVKSFIVE